MAAVLDREAVWTPGAEQWYAVEPTARIYRHTFVGVDASGLLRPLGDVAGREYVGVAGQAVFPGGGRRCPVLQRGSGRFRFPGTAAQADVGLIAYAVDDETVTTNREAVAEGYAVGKLAGLGTDGLVRVSITGFAGLSPGRLLGALRRHFSLGPEEVTLTLSTEHRFGLTLPHSFGELTYAAELVCASAAVGAKVLIRPNTARRTAGFAEWTVYAPADTPGAAGGSVTFDVLAHFAGEGWTEETTGIVPSWTTPAIIAP